MRSTVEISHGLLDRCDLIQMKLEELAALVKARDMQSCSDPAEEKSEEAEEILDGDADGKGSEDLIPVATLEANADSEEGVDIHAFTVAKPGVDSENTDATVLHLAVPRHCNNYIGSLLDNGRADRDLYEFLRPAVVVTASTAMKWYYFHLDVPRDNLVECWRSIRNAAAPSEADLVQFSAAIAVGEESGRFVWRVLASGRIEPLLATLSATPRANAGIDDPDSFLAARALAGGWDAEPREFGMFLRPTRPSVHPRWALLPSPPLRMMATGCLCCACDCSWWAFLPSEQWALVPTRCSIARLSSDRSFPSSPNNSSARNATSGQYIMVSNLPWVLCALMLSGSPSNSGNTIQWHVCLHGNSCLSNEFYVVLQSDYSLITSELRSLSNLKFSGSFGWLDTDYLILCSLEGFMFSSSVQKLAEQIAVWLTSFVSFLDDTGGINSVGQSSAKLSIVKYVEIGWDFLLQGNQTGCSCQKLGARLVQVIVAELDRRYLGATMKQHLSKLVAENICCLSPWKLLSAFNFSGFDSGDFADCNSDGKCGCVAQLPCLSSGVGTWISSWMCLYRLPGAR